jgi:hypothetical protein
MTTQIKTLIDPQLADAQTLQPVHFPAESFGPLVDHVARHTAAEPTHIGSDPNRDTLLADYRQSFDQQHHHDLSYNLQSLWHWAESLNRRHDVLRDGQVFAAFERLDGLRQSLLGRDAWSSMQAEIDCGLQTSQFYHDALALADRLCRLERGQRLRRRPSGSVRRATLPGGASDRLLQAGMNTGDVVISGLAVIKPLRAFLPALLYQGALTVIPWPPFRYMTWLSKLKRIVESGALGSLNGLGSDIVDCRGIAEFRSDPYFFDQRTGSTRHNIILAFCHRHSTFDDATMACALDGLNHGAWLNATYFPRSTERDSNSILVYPAGKKSMSHVLSKSAHLLEHLRIPLVIYVDGGVSYLCYGQQMRIKRGIRLLTDYMAARGSKDRRTYIVPISLNDPTSFVRGLDNRIRITCHQPIDIDNVEASPSKPDRSQVNWGDPLLNHLEAHFLTNTGQVRHGWQTPRVVDTVQCVAAQLQNDRTLRGRWRKRFHASLRDLAKGTPATQNEC